MCEAIDPIDWIKALAMDVNMLVGLSEPGSYNRNALHHASRNIRHELEEAASRLTAERQEARETIERLRK